MSDLSATVPRDPDKQRIDILVSPDVKKALIDLAKDDKRSLNNYLEVLLEAHVKASGKKS